MQPKLTKSERFSVVKYQMDVDILNRLILTRCGNVAEFCRQFPTKHYAHAKSMVTHGNVTLDVLLQTCKILRCTPNELGADISNVMFDIIDVIDMNALKLFFKHALNRLDSTVVIDIVRMMAKPQLEMCVQYALDVIERKKDV